MTGWSFCFSRFNRTWADSHLRVTVDDGVWICRLAVVIGTLALDEATELEDDVRLSNWTATESSQLNATWPDAAEDDGGWLSDCHWVQQILLLLHVVLVMISLLLEVSMAHIALKGTMWNVAPRHFMEYVVYARLRTLDLLNSISIHLTSM